MFIYSSNIYLLRAYYVPGTVLGTAYPVRNKTGLGPVLVRVTV